MLPPALGPSGKSLCSRTEWTRARHVWASGPCSSGLKKPFCEHGQLLQGKVLEGPTAARAVRWWVLFTTENSPACHEERRRFVFTQDERDHGMGGRTHLSMDRTTAHQGKIRAGSIQCCMSTEFPATGRARGLPPSCISPFTLTNTAILCHLLPRLTERTLPPLLFLLCLLVQNTSRASTRNSTRCC